MRGLHGQLVHLSPAMGKMEVGGYARKSCCCAEDVFSLLTWRLLPACNQGGQAEGTQISSGVHSLVE